MEDLLGSSLSKVEYLTTFVAFIFGYVVSRFFSGWARIISYWKEVHFSVEHFAWSLLSFGILIDLWWTAWMRLAYIEASPASFYVSILSPFVMYLLSSLYFPIFKDREITNLKVYYAYQRRKGYFLYALFFSTIIITSVFFEEIRIDIFFEVAGLIFSLIALFTARRWMERTVLVSGYALIITHYYLMPSYFDSIQWAINGFSFSEYTSVFITFIYGFIVAKFLDGWSYFIVNKKALKIHVFYVLWTILIFGLLVDFWWGLWDRNEIVSRRFVYFFVSLLVPFGFYIITSLLFPEKGAVKDEVNEGFKKNSKLIYASFIFIFLMDFITSQMLQINFLFGIENLFRLIAILLAGLGILINKKRMDWIVLVVSWVLLILHNVQSFL
jgi:hypothetical protein